MHLNTKNKRRLFATGLLVTISAGLCTLPAVAKDAPPPEVSVLILEPQQISRERSLPGRIIASRQSDVRPQVDGIITQRLFEEGSEVEKGQQLYQIDATRYQAVLSSTVADLRSAVANLKAVQARAKRYNELLQKNVISRQETDDAEASLGQAQAAIGVAQSKVELAKIDVDYTKVYAPISGRISRSFVSEGALVTANQAKELATITALNPVYVDMQQSAADQGAVDLQVKLTHNSTVPVHLMLERASGESRYEHTGRLKFSEVTMDQGTGAIMLRAEIPNPDGYLLPGMFVRAVLNLGQQQALLLPQRAATRTPQGQLRVWVVDSEGRANPRSVSAEAAYRDNWIVASGLKAGDSVIIEGYQKVKPSQQVKTVVWQNPQAEHQADAGAQ